MNQEIQRSMSTAVVSNGLVFIPDFAGYVYCFDAATGKLHWKHDTEGRIWGSPLVAEGRVYVGNESGDVTVLEARGGDKPVEVGKSNMEGPVYSTPVAANGVLYIMGESRLWAAQKKD
jgi:outer membrane protein assembly factor BamB